MGAISYMQSKERVRFILFLTARPLVAIFDVIGIVAIGFLGLSVALFVTDGSDVGRTVKFAGLEFVAINSQTLFPVSSIILSLFLIKAFLSILLTRQLALFLARIEARAAADVARRSFEFGMSELRKFSREEVSFAIQHGSTKAFSGVLNHSAILIAEGFLFISIMVTFFLVDPVVTVFTIIYFGVILTVLQFFLGRGMTRAGNNINRGTIDSESAISDLSIVLRESYVLGRHDYFYKRIYNSRSLSASSNANQFMLSGMPRYIIETALIMGISAFIFFQSSSGNIISSVGTIGVFISGGVRLIASLLPLQNALLQIKADIPTANTALSLLTNFEITTKSKQNFAILNLEVFDGVEIEFRNVFFTYPGSSDMALSNISFRIRPGMQVAFIGPSGAGKSTLVDLILGLLTPSRGQVLINERLPDHLISSNPGLIGYVPQNPGMITGSIAENIAIGLPLNEIDQIKLDQAIQGAHLKDLINSLPDGVDTNIGKRKDELSAGQLQRIGIARALYCQPKLLILDEATNALDALSENEISKIIEEMRGKVTIILIAHRLNTIQKSDVVYLLESSRVTASGTFRDLLEGNTTVQKLVSLISIDHFTG